jgi:hypothetical protein
MNQHVGQHTGDRALDLLADKLGAEIIAIGAVDSPLPVTAPCSRCGTTTTRYGPAGSPYATSAGQVRQGRRTGLRRPPSPVARWPDLRRSALPASRRQG